VDNNTEAGIFLTLNECSVLFPRLKRNESSLSVKESAVMLRIEKYLYENLSISEMEELFEGALSGMGRN